MGVGFIISRSVSVHDIGAVPHKQLQPTAGDR